MMTSYRLFSCRNTAPLGVWEVGLVKGKGRFLLALLAVLAPLLSGCVFSDTMDGLYQLPQLPAEYTELQSLLDAIQDQGAEYAAPTSGANIQPVQLVDLDGDGTQEAVAFFRRAGDEQPLKIYIFQSVGGTYRQAALMECGGASFSGIQYVDLDGDGTLEVLAGWRATAELQALSVYALRRFVPTLLLSTNYVRFAAADLNGDGRQELTILRSDGEESVAEFYGWQANRTLALQSGTRLSMTMAELQDVTVGTLSQGEPALFVTGVAEETRAITDILACRDGRLVNLTVSPSTGVTTEIFRYVGLRPADIDEDGSTEVPMPALLPSEEGDLSWKIYWRRYSEDGRSQEVALTYHNLEEAWFLLMPEEWDDRIMVTRSGGGGERVTTFRCLRQNQWTDFLSIYTITGSSRESQAARGGRFILVRQGGGTIYAASFPEEGRPWIYGLDEEELRQRFRLILGEWSGQ